MPALERMAGFVEAVGRSHDIAEPLQMTLGVSDGERLYAVRYASGPEVNSLYVSNDAADVRLLYPENERFKHLSDEAGLSSRSRSGISPAYGARCHRRRALIVQPGADEEVPFTPRPPG